MFRPMINEHTNVRQHILDTAKPIILGKGFSAVGLTELLSAAEVPKGSFYHYFKSKEAFGKALLDSYFANYQKTIAELLKNGGGTASDRLMRYWQLWLDTQATDGMDGKCLAVKLGSEVSDLSESMRVSLEQGTHRVIELIADCIIDGQQDGSLPRHIVATDCALALYNLWLGATVLTKIRRDRSALEAAMLVTKDMLKKNV